MFKRLLRHLVPTMRLSDGLRVVRNLADSNGTRLWYDAAVRSFIGLHGNLPVDQITREMVKEWSKWLDTACKEDESPYSPDTINSYRRAVRAFFNSLVELEHIKASPANGVPIPDPPRKEPKHFSKKESMRLLKHSRGDLRDNAMMHLLYETGCRLSELHSMRVSCVHFERRKADGLRGEEKEILELAEMMGVDYMIKSQYAMESRGKALVVGKTGPRFVYFGHEACMILRAYLESRPHNAPDALWLDRATGQPITPQSIYHAFKKMANKAGVEGTPHMMRHTFAFRLASAGADLKMIQRLMGHADVSTTLLYYDFTDDELWSLHEQLTQQGSS